MFNLLKNYVMKEKYVLGYSTLTTVDGISDISYYLFDDYRDLIEFLVDTSKKHNSFKVHYFCVLHQYEDYNFELPF